MLITVALILLEVLAQRDQLSTTASNRWSVSIGLLVADATFQRISIKHSGFNPDRVIEASFKVLRAVPDIMKKYTSSKIES